VIYRAKARRQICARRRIRRVAWWLVWAYPPKFRRDVGLGLVDALEDRMRERRARGATRFNIGFARLATRCGTHRPNGSMPRDALRGEGHREATLESEP
jgi:hypothetical protein